MKPKKHQLTVRRRYRMGTKSKPKQISKASNKTKKILVPKNPMPNFEALKICRTHQMIEHEKKETLKFLIVQSELLFMFLFVYDFEKKIIIPLFTK